MLELLSKNTAEDARRPLIALGAPIRNWIKRNWNVDLEVMDVGTIPLSDGSRCAVIASNHPSFFFYAVRSYGNGPDAEKKNLAAGLAVMKQDIVAAAWHAEMGRNPDSDPIAVLKTSTAKWANRDAELLDLVKRQSGIASIMSTPLTLKQILPAILSKDELNDLEKRFYSQ